MALISDLLLLSATVAAFLYCFILSIKFKRLRNKEAQYITALNEVTSQVDRFINQIECARRTLKEVEHEFNDRIHKGNSLARRLELLIASLHDIPEFDTDPVDSEVLEDFSPAVPFLRAARVAQDMKVGANDESTE